MPLRRSLLTVLCLAIFGSIPCVAQEKDPFGDWDREQPRTAAQSRPLRRVELSAANAPEKSTVTYFSPAAEGSAAAVSVKPDAPATIPMREKAKTRVDLEQPLSAARQHTAPSTVSAVVEPEPLQPALTTGSKAESGQISTVAFSPDESEAPRAGGVRSATFSPDAEPSSAKRVRIVAAEPDAADSASQFEEFLGAANPAKQFKAPAEFDSESATPLVHRPDLAGAPLKPARPTGASRVIAEDAAAPAPAISDENSGPQSPGVTVQWVKHGGFNVGQECDVELVVKNTSQTIVRSVMAEAVIPPNVEVVEARPAAVEGSEMPTWTFGELQPGQSRSVMLKVIPQTRGDVRLDAYVRLTGTSSTQFAVQEPMIGVVVSGPESVEIGQQVGYIVRVSNPGTGLANNVVIQAAVPEGLEHRNGSLLTIEIGTLNPGESRQARLSLTAVQGGNQQLAVRVLADGGLSDQTTTPIVVAEPQLAIVLAGPQEQIAGRSEDYTLTVSNGGNVQSTNVRAKYIIPDGFTFVSADRGGKFIETDNAVEWFVGTLQPNDTSDFIVTMKASETGEVAHKAGVISEHGQVTTCELTSSVIGTAALDMKIATDHRELRVGEEISWEVQVRNTGTREATNVGVSCELPAGFEFINAEGPTKHIAEHGVLIFRSIPTIDAATDVKFVIHGRCTREGNQRLRLRVASDSVTEALIGEEFASVTR